MFTFCMLLLQDWPLWKRDLTLVIICMAGAVGTLTPLPEPIIQALTSRPAGIGILGPIISAHQQCPRGRVRRQLPYVDVGWVYGSEWKG